MSQSEYISETRKALQDIRELARVHLHRPRQRQAMTYDQRTPAWTPFALGQTCLAEATKTVEIWREMGWPL